MSETRIRGPLVSSAGTIGTRITSKSVLETVWECADQYLKAVESDYECEQHAIWLGSLILHLLLQAPGFD